MANEQPATLRMSQYISMMQFPDFFRDTMKKNIKYGLWNATDDEVEAAAKHKNHVSVMLFDEATSALDHENEDNFKERTSQPRKTTVIIA
ncbi:unnamed protein product [Clonostachys rosea f. rosea IK726]|uniref:Uncharacterized protein n=1 Tax=Clonostachys rosea f. rosea IK726 TaxID=1349383 RepID=A0ACA9TCA4_BIOOC|nr:unnamed protein product [Clonostachys rosea f. rosea IK726]